MSLKDSPKGSSSIASQDPSESLQEAPSISPQDPLQPSIAVSKLPSSTSTILSSLALEYRRLGAEIKERVEVQKEIKEEIEAIALSIPVEKIVGKGWNLTRGQKTTKVLNNTKLVEESTRRQIDPIDVVEIIAFATEEKKGKEFITVTEGDREEVKEELFS